MRRFVFAILLPALAAPAFAKTHSDIYKVPCKVLWPAVKDTLRNSGKYGIIGIDNTEMTASYNIGGSLGGKRINSLVLNSKENSCELQVQTAYSGFTHDDAGDLKKRIDESLAKLQAAQPTTSAKPDAPASQPAKPEASTDQSASPAKPPAPNRN
jgi:hypothetical protein